MIMGEGKLLNGFGFDLSGRTVLVTGASSGIGKRFAEILADSGANVVITARRTALLEKLKRDIEEKGGRALTVAMDAVDEASTIAAFDAAEAEFGSVDSVVANAGINVPGSTLGMSAEVFDSVFAVNLRGVFLTAREGARRMIAQGSVQRAHGRIVIISSVTATQAPYSASPYAASKAAVTQLGRTMAKDWANKGINVNIIAPGYMQTEMTDELWSMDKGRKLLENFPRRRLMEVNALDPMLLYLCSDASAQLTGSVFTIDDGQTL